MVLRFLLRNWLQGMARDHIREKATAAARIKTAEPRDGDLKADVGIIFALSIEAGGMADLLDSFHATRGHGFTARRGSRHGRSLVLVESGAGPHRAAAAAEALIEAHRPGLVISAGFAGGLVANIKRYEIVVADSLINIEGQIIGVELKVDIAELLRGVHVGRVLSLDEIARRPGEKEALGRRYNAWGVDLESFAVAEVCRRHGVGFMCARVITDAMNEELPADVQCLTAQKTPAARLGAALGLACRRPGSIKDMWRLKETALVGSDRLGRFLDSVIPVVAACRARI